MSENIIVERKYKIGDYVVVKHGGVYEDGQIVHLNENVWYDRGVVFPSYHVQQLNNDRYKMVGVLEIDIEPMEEWEILDYIKKATSV